MNNRCDFFLNNEPNTAPLGGGVMLQPKLSPYSSYLAVQIQAATAPLRIQLKHYSRRYTGALGRGALPFRSTAAALCYLTTDSTMRPLVLWASNRGPASSGLPVPALGQRACLRKINDPWCCAMWATPWVWNTPHLPGWSSDLFLLACLLSVSAGHRERGGKAIVFPSLWLCA